MDHHQLNPSSSSARTDRKTIERNRRNQMKVLCSKLNSLVTHQTSKEVASLPDQLDEAATYIKKLQVSLEKMKEKKNSLMGIHEKSSTSNNDNSRVFGMASVKTPQIEVHEKGSALEVVLRTGLDCQSMFKETIRLLHEEGANIFNASFTVVNEDTIFHAIHCQVREFGPSPGAARIAARLKKFVDEANESRRS